MKFSATIFATSFIALTLATGFSDLNVGHLAKINEEKNKECAEFCKSVDMELSKCDDSDPSTLAECICKKDDDFFPELMECDQKCDKLTAEFKGNNPKDTKQKICKLAGIEYNGTDFKATTKATTNAMNGASTLGASFLAVIGVLLV
ncbi:uncharacterized protein SPAPADRAFT_64399 [Spathaspora passalidarum NRRL Y-27907]|uniref:Extracellular membrane protein CFEM domain-containing protein n=1 Tax=Spathaspora passalidarum (strain NRRL Y-27907 / 11-Y1) TaxID=619300 RepID=G3AGA3_SPAPN|nr:uncharacterized protein SPAPADRAFT_64399 [Spathaspora passalidarum NRRL Y-27907]EGW35242.1 hypothetical protein SPAPADRAFT_64399 [Spathaspora passalidarum NRRL Y-27907]